MNLFREKIEDTPGNEIYTSDMWNDLENKIILYANDTALYAEVASHSGCINVANSFNRDLVKIQSWCST